jgi:hypothetical protein
VILGNAGATLGDDSTIKFPATKLQFSTQPNPPRGYPPFCQMGLLLYPSITNLRELFASYSWLINH